MTGIKTIVGTLAAWGVLLFLPADGNEPTRDPVHPRSAIHAAGDRVLGPVLAGILADLQDGFALPLLVAAALVVLGGVFVALDRHFSAA